MTITCRISGHNKRTHRHASDRAHVSRHTCYRDGCDWEVIYPDPSPEDVAKAITAHKEVARAWRAEQNRPGRFRIAEVAMQEMLKAGYTHDSLDPEIMARDAFAIAIAILEEDERLSGPRVFPM